MTGTNRSLAPTGATFAFPALPERKLAPPVPQVSLMGQEENSKAAHPCGNQGRIAGNCILKPHGARKSPEVSTRIRGGSVARGDLCGSEEAGRERSSRAIIGLRCPEPPLLSCDGPCRQEGGRCDAGRGSGNHDGVVLVELNRWYSLASAEYPTRC